MKIFGMVTTRSSERYTPVALKSFLACTTFDHRDRFVLIDNDASYTLPEEFKKTRIEFTQNRAPLGFAENMNTILTLAKESKFDAVLLNNDVAFTPEWFEPMKSGNDAIVSPLSSREVRYTIGDFQATNPMELDAYLGHEGALKTIAEENRKRNSGRMGVLALPFFTALIPYRIIEKVGLLDEGYGRGGGEDYDYCLRAIEAGFSVHFEMSSYVLHFGGKSSWSGAETKGEQNSRENQFLSRFEHKWGERLFRIILKEEMSLLENDPEAASMIRDGNFRQAIEKLRGGRPS